METPPTQEPFSAAKPAHIWEYDKKVEAMKKALEQRKQEHELITGDLLKEDEGRKKELADQLDNISVPMDREVGLPSAARFIIGFQKKPKIFSSIMNINHIQVCHPKCGFVILGMNLVILGMNL